MAGTLQHALLLAHSSGLKPKSVINLLVNGYIM
jgi:hypothetical protein